MKRLFTQRLKTAVLCTAALLATGAAWAQSPAKLAPADTAVYIHVQEPSAWFADLTEGPLGEKMRQKIQTAEGSGDLLAALGMSLDQFMAAYFGGDLVVLSPGEDKDGVIFTEVAQADRDRAIDSLGLKRIADIAGQPTYTGDDGNGVIVMTDDWVALADLNAVEYLASILSQPDNAPRLADTEQYAKWTRELPADRAMTMLVSESEKSEHALGVVRKGKGLDATYLGVSPDFDEMMSMLGQTDVASFGPLPADTIAAASFNLVANEEQAPMYAGLDPLLRGKSFAKDVMPKLDAPTLLFMASVAGEDLEPALTVDLPVVGLAVKMNDDSAAADLKNMFDGASMLANFAVAEFNAGPIPMRSETYKNANYDVAEIGKPIAQGLSFPELAPIQIVYGQIGDYYLMCTQEQYFKRCVDANAAGKGMRMAVEGPAHRLAKKPVMAMTGKPDGFAEMMRTWVKLLEDKGLPEILEANNPTPMDIENLYDVVTMLQQYSGMKFQVWQGDDGLVIGRAQLNAPQ